MEHLIELTRSVREIRDEARERQREVAAQMQETDRRMKETDRRLRRAENLFTTQWGKLMESLVEGDLVRLLQARGVSVEGTLQRSRKRRNGQHFEIDILATNRTEVVAVEVKTTLRPEGVGSFVEKLSRFLEWYPGVPGANRLRSGRLPRRRRRRHYVRRASGSVRHPRHGQERQHRERGGLRAAVVRLSWRSRRDRRRRAPSWGCERPETGNR